MRDLIRRVLTQHGYQVLEAEQGEQGFLCTTKMPDLFI